MRDDLIRELAKQAPSLANVSPKVWEKLARYGTVAVVIVLGYLVIVKAGKAVGALLVVAIPTIGLILLIIGLSGMGHNPYQ